MLLQFLFTAGEDEHVYIDVTDPTPDLTLTIRERLGEMLAMVGGMPPVKRIVIRDATDHRVLLSIAGPALEAWERRPDDLDVPVPAPLRPLSSDDEGWTDIGPIGPDE
jgi:hypothetical protein